MKHFKSIGKYILLYSIVFIYLELFLRFCMDGHITGNFLFFLCFIPAQAIFLTMLSGFFHDRKNGILSSVFILFLEAYYIAQLIYYKNFGSLFSASMAGMGAEAVGNFGWTLTGVIRENAGNIFLMLLPAFVIGGLSFFRILHPEKITWKPRLILLILTVPVWFLGVLITRLDGNDLQSAYVIYHDLLVDTDTTAAHLGALATTIIEFSPSHRKAAARKEELLTAVNMDILTSMSGSAGMSGDSGTSDSAGAQENSAAQNGSDLGASDDSGTQDTSGSGSSNDSDAQDTTTLPPAPTPQIYEEIDLQKLAEEATDPAIRELSLFLDSRGAAETNAYTGMFEGYNLIYICAESFWTYAIDEQVTPTLYKMSNQGILLNNYYNSFKNTTTNGEYAFDTSLWPDLSGKANGGTDVGSFPQSAKKFMPLGLGDFFTEIGVPSYAYHNYYGTYYRRCYSWPNLGYTSKFMGKDMKFTSSWPASDLELMEQSVDDYIDEEQFHAYYMTFSGHGPYSENNYIDRKNIDFVRENMPEGYPEPIYYYLAGNRELDKAMEYLLTRLEEAGKLDNTVIVIAGDHYPYNLPTDCANQLVGRTLDTEFEIYKSTCIIYNTGMENPITTDTYCSNVDILPTVLNLFGIPYDSRLMIGRDIFADGLHKAVIYNKSFITDLVRYNRRTGETVWSELAADFTEEMKEEYLNAMNQLLDSEFYASTQILNLNFYEYVWYHSGLMTEEELAAEKQRAAYVEAENDRYNEEHRPKEPEPEPAPAQEPSPEGAAEGMPVPEGAPVQEEAPVQ